MLHGPRMGERVDSRIPVVSARSFSKTFAGRTVLNNVDLAVHPGEVHGFVGQNGSGKSTFIKILSGYHAPDSGSSLYIGEREVPLPVPPGGALKSGMSFVHQDLGLADTMTILETLRLGRYETKPGWRIPWSSERRLVSRALERFGIEASPDAAIGTLSEVDRAMVAILRALDSLRAHEFGLLVLDEPTAYLPRDGVDRLFAAVREAAADGFGILFVSHRLEEVLAITDVVSILRDGQLVATHSTQELTEDRLIEEILGFSLGDLYPERDEPQGDVLMSVRGLSSPKVRDFSLDLRVGEIVGLTGLLGMGFDEVPYLLFGAEQATAGRLELGGKDRAIGQLTPKESIRSGVVLLPANRLRDGSVGAATVSENITLPTLSKYFDRGFLRRGRERTRVRSLLDRFHVVPPEPERDFATLSGGNQQKGLVAKWFETRPKVLLLHEPTQGVDVGAKREIFANIRDAVAGGASAIVASTEYEDLAHLCDRVIVFRDARAVSQLSGAALTEERIVEQSFREQREQQDDNGQGPPTVIGATA